MLQKGGKLEFKFLVSETELSFIFQFPEIKLQFHFSVSFTICWLAQKHLGKGSPVFPLYHLMLDRVQKALLFIVSSHLMPLVAYDIIV